MQERAVAAEGVSTRPGSPDNHTIMLDLLIAFSLAEWDRAFRAGIPVTIENTAFLQFLNRE